MGFTAAGPRHYYASGHPGNGVDLPQPVGLIETRDGGRSWKVLSRGGESDFHALTAAPAGVVGFDGAVRVSRDGTSWTEGTTPGDVASLAAAPDGSTVLAATPQGRLYLHPRHDLDEGAGRPAANHARLGGRGHRSRHHHRRHGRGQHRHGPDLEHRRGTTRHSCPRDQRQPNGQRPTANCRCSCPPTTPSRRPPTTEPPSWPSDGELNLRHLASQKRGCRRFTGFAALKAHTLAPSWRV